MSTVEIQKEVEIIRLTNILNESANKYYNGQTPTLSDIEYDTFLERLKRIEDEADMRLFNSPTNRVGYSVLSSIPTKMLPRIMLSLDKLKNDTVSLIKWMKKRRSIMSLKLDGLSCMLEYIDGILVGCYTRGNGIEGSDVTEMVKSLPTVPNRLRTNESVLVIGEIIIRKHKFDKINEQREKDGENKFANPRNLASGTLLSLDTSLGRERGLEFVAFDIEGNLSSDRILVCESQQDKLFNLEINNFSVVPYEILNGDETDVYIDGQIDWLKGVADGLGYAIDGIVVSYNDSEIRKSCKPTEKHPTHSIAYKFEDEHEETVLRDIELSMSRNGILTPVAIFDTVELDGTEVSRANVHNVSILRVLKLGIGDTIKVVKANQIIPQVTENKTQSDTYEIPTQCPYCGGELEQVGDETIDLVCFNKNNRCYEQEMLRINHFLSKEALNAKGVSEKTITRLMSLGEVKNLYDVLELPNNREYLINKKYHKLGRQIISNICESIERSCETTLDRFLIGLGLDGVGKKVAKDIAKKYGSIDNLMTLISIDSLKTISGINNSARTIYNEIKKNEEHIRKLLQYVELDAVEEEVAPTGSALKGKTFVFTGKTSEFKNRKEVEEFIVANGGKMSGSVSKSTSYLICNVVSTSSSYKKAQELGIEIITDNKLKGMVK